MTLYVENSATFSLIFHEILSSIGILFPPLSQRLFPTWDPILHMLSSYYTSMQREQKNIAKSMFAWGGMTKWVWYGNKRVPVYILMNSSLKISEPASSLGGRKMSFHAVKCQHDDHALKFIVREKKGRSCFANREAFLCSIFSFVSLLSLKCRRWERQGLFAGERIPWWWIICLLFATTLLGCTICMAAKYGET